MYNPDTDKVNTMVHDVHALVATGVGVSPVDGKGTGQTDETEEQKLARFTKRYEEAVATIGSIDRKALEGLPAASRSAADMERVLAEVEKKRDAMEAERNKETAEKFVAVLGVGAGLGAIAAADKGMLPAGAGVFSPEELAKQNPQKFPVNKELEQILAKAGLNKEPLMLAGVTDPKHVGREESGQLSYDQNLPNRSPELAKGQEQSGGRQRSVSA